jgi:transposase InsO family protein
MTAHLRRLGHQVSVATVDRLMRDEGLNGVIRGKNHRTTILAKNGKRAGDRLDRNFTAACPNRVWVADFTYCRTWAGFVYVAFIIDVFSRKIVGWHAMTTRPTELVTVPLRMALWNRRHEGIEIFEGLIHHSDAGSQGGFNWSSQHLQVVEVFDGGDGGLEQEDQRCSRGCAPAVACRSGVTPADAVARFAFSVAGGSAAVLASDRDGYHFS